MVAAAGPLTRRALLGAGAVGALAAAGCGEGADPVAGHEDVVLEGLLAIERELVEAWGAAARLPGAAGATARAVLAHERAHATRLERELGARGVAVPAPPDPVSEPARAMMAAARSGDRAAALRASLLLERRAGAAYLAALPALRSPARRALVMAIGASEAQHASVVLAALGREPLPDAFGGALPA